MNRPEKIRRVACPACDAKPGARCNEHGRERESNHRARIRAHSKAHPPRPRVMPPAGFLAWHDSRCWMCDKPIQRHVHQVVERKGEWIHTTCAPGQEDV